MTVFWDDAQCTLVDINRRFSEVGNLSYLPTKVKEEIKIHVLKLQKYVFRPTRTNFLCLSYHVSVQISATEDAREKEKRSSASLVKVKSFQSLKKRQPLVLPHVLQKSAGDTIQSCRAIVGSVRTVKELKGA
jgi:hypothetical protein